MAPTLHLLHFSPPARAVLITAKAIGVTLNEKEILFTQGEQMKPEFLKLNPQHTVPTLIDDDGFIIWDSHAIMIYLLSKYSKNDSLYPKNLKKRAIIDQRLYFDSGVLFAVLRKIVKPVFKDRKNVIDQEDKDAVVQGYDILEALLDGKKWVAGDEVTIADYSLISTVTSLNVLVPIRPEKYARITAWLKECEGLPECQVNKKGLQDFSEIFKRSLINI